MTVELWMLAASIALGMIHLIASSHLISWQRGYRWTASSREETVPPLHGVTNRVDQAATNFLETFPFFVALVLITHVINHHSALTIWGVHLYFWARLAYLIAAAAGLGLVRSVVCWNAAFVGIAFLFFALFLKEVMLSPTLLGVIICIAAAILEGALAGKGARQRLAQLRMPPYSPPFALWLVIGFLFYAMCFVILRHILTTGLISHSQVFAFLLTIVLLLANALWSVLFFRWRDLRASFIAFVPYAVLVAGLAILLAGSYPLGAILLSCYCIYLIYATRWGYHVWQLNAPNT